MTLAIVLGVVVLLLLAATVAGAAVSRRSPRRMDAAERSAVTRPKPAQPQAPAGVDNGLPAGETVEVPPHEPVPEAPIAAEPVAGEGAVEEAPVEEPAPVRPRLRDRLGKARALLAGYFGDLRSRTTIDDDVWDEIEEALIRADVGVGPTERILDDLRRRAKEAAVVDAGRAARPAEGRSRRHAAVRRPVAVVRARCTQRLDVRRGQRRREDDQHRQDRPAGGGRRPPRGHGRRRHVPGRRRRAAPAVVAAGRRRSRPGAGRRRSRLGRLRRHGRRRQPGQPTSCWSTPPAGSTPRST